MTGVPPTIGQVCDNYGHLQRSPPENHILMGFSRPPGPDASVREPAANAQRRILNKATQLATSHVGAQMWVF